MKHDSTKYNEREIRLIGMTANHTSRPDKVLFFADPHFLFKCLRTLHTLPKPHEPTLKPKLAKECNLATASKRNP